MTEKTSTCHCSTGRYSTGHQSTGHCSTGNYSTGHQSTGHQSTGNYSTGYQSTGSHSTGHQSTGSHSTGHLSTGHLSTGNWSTSDLSTGHFCTKDGKGFGAFNKKLHKKYEESVRIWNEAEKPECLFFSITEWVALDMMSQSEKEQSPSSSITGGFLKVYDYKEAFTKSVTSASKEERDLIRALPNFNDEVFFEISGCDLRLLDK